MPPPIKVRGAARSKGIPQGYILGRSSRGNGDVELLRPGNFRAVGLASAGQIAAVTGVHGFGFFAGGTLLDAELLGSGTFPGDISFVNGDPNSSVTAEFASAATAVLNVKAADPITGLDVVVATFTFSAGNKTAAIAWTGGSYILKAGKVIKLFAPHPADTSLANVHGTITGSEG